MALHITNMSFTPIPTSRNGIKLCKPSVFIPIKYMKPKPDAYESKMQKIPVAAEIARQWIVLKLPKKRNV